MTFWVRCSVAVVITLGTKNAGRRQTKQNHNMVLCQIVNQTDDSGNVNIINSSILQLAIIYLSYLKQRKYIIRNQQTMKIPVQL
jgi:hypothetical protein